MKNSYLVIFILISIFSFYSCHDKTMQNLKLNNEKFSVYFDSGELIDNIKKYSEIVNFPEIISLKYSTKKDTVVFEMQYELNIFSLIVEPPIYYKELNENIVFITTEKKLLKKYSDGPLDTIMKRCFPQDYEFMKKEMCPPPIGYQCEIWILKFVDGKLVEREKQPIPETEENRWTKEKFN